MKINKWLGLITAASPYSIPAGAAAAQTNLQIRKPGQLIPRPGLTRLYGSGDKQTIYAIYRLAGGSYGTDILFIYYAQRQPKLTPDLPTTYKYAIAALTNSSGSLSGSTIWTTGLTQAWAPTFTEDRFGRLFVFFGHGEPPIMYRRGATSAVTMGVPAPNVAPVVTPSGAGYFLERVDVVSGGGAYWTPPSITFTGGTPVRAAKVKGVVQGGNLVAVDIIDGGNNYSTAPSVSIDATNIGRGFRGVGVIAVDNNINGFTSAVTPAVTGTALSTSPKYTHGYSLSTTAPKIAVKNAAGGVDAIDCVYDATANRYTAIIPVTGTTNSATGLATAGINAKARFEFSAIGLTFQIASAFDTASTGVVNWYFGTGYTSASSTATYRRTVDEKFFAITASSTVYRWGGEARGGDAKNWLGVPIYPFRDAYFPDYRYLSYRLCSGVFSNDAAQWTRYQVAVQKDATSYFIDIGLVPAKKADGSAYTRTATAVAPTVRVRFNQCPASWLLSPVTQRPYQYWEKVKYNQAGVAWWGNNSNVLSRPIVDFWNSASTYGFGAGSVTVLTQGTGWEQGTMFVLRFEQGDAYDQTYIENGTHVANIARVHPPVDGFAKHYREFYFYANTAEAVSGGGPAGAVYGTPSITIPGSSYNLNDRVKVTLMSRPTDPTWTTAVSPYVETQTYTFTAITVRQATQLSRIASVTVVTPGSGYYSPPELLPSGGGGYGLRLEAVVNNGQVTSVNVLDGGTGFVAQPDIYTSDQGATAIPVMRSSMRGIYRCAYRYADWTQTVVDIAQITAISGDTVTLDDATPIMPDMILEGTRIPFMAKVISVTGNSVRLSQTPTNVTGGLSRVSITAAGSGYTSAPTVTVGGTGTGASVSAVLDATGAVASVSIDQAGTGYGLGPITLTLSAPSSGTTATAVAYIDDAVTVRDMTQPIAYSDFSPITDVDAGPNSDRQRCSEMIWNLSGAVPPSRAQIVEFYRTSGDESLVFYRLEMYGTVADTIQIQGTDTLNDEELFNPDRPFYAALPVVLPNGAVNAYRFGVPRTDMAVAVQYQDRIWYAVSTSGNDLNTVLFSEYDEFESCPDVNELPIQNNLKTTDYLTALVPFGSFLVAYQTSHAYAISYNTDPIVDSTVQMLSHRGCVSQQCWDIHDNVIYAMDERGIYSLDRSGEVAVLSEAIRNLFDEELIDWERKERFFLKVDNRTNILRAFVSLGESAGPNPEIALCYHITNNTWWTESWPNGLTGCTVHRPASDRANVPIYGAIDGNLYEMKGDRDQLFRSIQSVTVTSGGSGYLTAPTVTVTAGQEGQGAEFAALVVDGQVTEILIIRPGFGYGSLNQLVDPEVWTGTVNLTISPPPSGTTATATATASQPDNLKQSTVGWLMKTGAMELVSDGHTKKGESLIDRSVVLTYKPTDVSCTLDLREYYNNSPTPRRNTMMRDRGTGFVHQTSQAKTTLDMLATRSSLGLATGVAKAQFAGRSLEDTAGGDRHIAVQISYAPVAADAGNPAPPQPIVYGLEVRGVVDGN